MLAVCHFLTLDDHVSDLCGIVLLYINFSTTGKELWGGEDNKAP